MVKALNISGTLHVRDLLFCPETNNDAIYVGSCVIVSVLGALESSFKLQCFQTFRLKKIIIISMNLTAIFSKLKVGNKSIFPLFEVSHLFLEGLTVLLMYLI